MAYKLNESALRLARKLIRNGEVAHDQRDDWSEHAPSAADENAYLDQHGWDEYADWYLGIDEGENEQTKGRYTFPFGDFRRVHRCGVISAESRAGQYDHPAIKDACAELLQLIDEHSG